MLQRISESIQQADDWFKENVGVSSGSLPVADYDSLNVRQVLKTLSRLGEEGLKAVQAYEKAHKNRTTILTEINARL